MNPAKLKYIMGHSSMDITFDTYTHLQVDDVREEMLKMVEVENGRSGKSKSYAGKSRRYFATGRGR